MFARRHAFAGLVLVLVLAGSSLALADGERWTFDGLVQQQIEDILDTLADRVSYQRDTDGAGDPMWRVEDVESGLSFSLYVYDDDENTPDEYESLLARAGFDMPTPPTIWTINGYNQSKRFVRAFLDDDGDPYVEADLDLRGGVTEDTIVRFLARFIGIIVSFASWIGFK